MSPIHIRAAKAEDAAIIALFNCQLAAQTEHKTLDEEIVLKGVSALLSDNRKGRYFIAEVAGTIVGQTMITYEWSDWRNANFWWIQSVYVHQNWRQQGVFRRLMEQISTLAAEDPACCGLRLYAHEENDPALQTYRKLGFYRLPYGLYEASAKYPEAPGRTS